MIDRLLVIKEIEASIKECNIHKKRADYALFHIKDMFPLTVEKYENLIENEEAIMDDVYKNKPNIKYSSIEYFDQFLYRYAKLQDKIGSSMIKNLANLLEYHLEIMTFIDYLNIAEKHSIIESVISWEELRGVRNSISHEYNDDTVYQVETLNKIYNSYTILVNVFENIKNKFGEIKKSNT